MLLTFDILIVIYQYNERGEIMDNINRAVAYNVKSLREKCAY